MRIRDAALALALVACTSTPPTTSVAPSSELLSSARPAGADEPATQRPRPILAAEPRADPVEAVRVYFDDYMSAITSCDRELIPARYPELASAMDLAGGVNIENLHVEGWCGGTRLSIGRVDLEAYGPVRVVMSGDSAEVTVHGIERFDYPRPRMPNEVSMGEFMKTVFLRRHDGGWIVVRTDEVTLPEWHARR